MKLKEQAIQQIDDICSVLHNSIKGFISGKLMMAVGFYVMTIPLFELFFNFFIDRYFNLVFGAYAQGSMFIFRTVFYWSLAIVIDRLCAEPDDSHSFVKKVFRVGDWLPIIVLSVSAALAIVGYSSLIAPFILILVGTFFMFYGQFTPLVVSIAAKALIIGGVAGILLTAHDIPYLWVYAVLYQGLIFLSMGYSLHIVYLKRQA